MRSLRFFSAECAAHAFGVHDHLTHVDAEEIRDHFLHLGGMLCRRMHRQRTVLAGIDQRGLRLEIEMILTAVAEHSFEHVLGGGHRGGGVAAADVARLADEALRGDGFVDAEDRRQLFEVDLDRLFRRQDRFT
jgi:hypothetical protein